MGARDDGPAVLTELSAAHRFSPEGIAAMEAMVDPVRLSLSLCHLPAIHRLTPPPPPSFFAFVCHLSSV